MTETMTPPLEEDKTYTGDMPGLRETATEIGSNEPEVFEVKLDDDDPTTLSVKDRAGIV
jgi:hypothetical protein